MDSIMQHYELVNFDDFSITGFLVPTGHYAQKIGLIDLFKRDLKIKMKTVHHTREPAPTGGDIPDAF